ncbi:MAG TPA: DUF4349 domain-containing protein [Solirubrobacterales bacterium]
METPRNKDDRLADELRALRPEPRPEFTAELDERAAAGFPRRSRLPRPPFSFNASGLKPRRLLLASGAFALLAIVVATAIVATSENEVQTTSSDQIALSELEPPKSAGSPEAREPKSRSVAPAGGVASSGGEAAGIQYAGETVTRASTESEDSSETASGRSYGSSLAPPEPKPRPRAVERSAELVLGAAPGDVGEDSSEVFEVVHAHEGIVMSSSTREGKPGQARARFELLIPSAKLSDALADLSAIDQVVTRHEATTDITAPTVTTGELLRDSKARIDSLLAQLEEAETESEREVVEAELRQERRHRASLRASLQNLQRRADLSRVLVRIETGVEDSPGDEGSWGIGDAIDDAGKILAVAAAVTVVALAILGPIALIALLAWLFHRAWVRRQRRRVLS